MERVTRMQSKNTYEKPSEFLVDLHFYQPQEPDKIEMCNQLMPTMQFKSLHKISPFEPSCSFEFGKDKNLQQNQIRQKLIITFKKKNLS